jgi:hypothetical protein
MENIYITDNARKQLQQAINRSSAAINRQYALGLGGGVVAGGLGGATLAALLTKEKKNRARNMLLGGALGLLGGAGIGGLISHYNTTDRRKQLNYLKHLQTKSKRYEGSSKQFNDKMKNTTRMMMYANPMTVPMQFALDGGFARLGNDIGSALTKPL